MDVQDIKNTWPVERSACQRITENNHAITDFQTDRLLEKILQLTNLNNAYRKVKSNKGAGGIDGMGVDELLPFLRNNQMQLIQQLKDGKYKPNPVRRVEIPKETKGEIRKLGVPTVTSYCTPRNFCLECCLQLA